ncbi:MAG: DUF975 family protein [Calditrichaeota bacterium]|nr:MAG: DUF975 family protein [Calditrichota bacterium]
MDQPLFSPGEAINYGWQKTKEHIAFMLAAMILVIVIHAALAFAQVALEDEIFLVFLMMVAGLVIGTVIEMGFFKIALKVYDGQEPDFNDLIANFHLFLYYFAAGLLYGVMVLVGVLLFIIPGIILAIQFYFAFYLIVDKAMGPISALEMASKLSRGSRWDLFVFFLALIILNIIGAMLLLIGLFATIPMSLFATAYVYRKLLEAYEAHNTESVVASE